MFALRMPLSNKSNETKDCGGIYSSADFKFDKTAPGKYERKDFRSAQEFGSRKFHWLCKAFIIMPWERAKVAVCAASIALARDNIS